MASVQGFCFSPPEGCETVATEYFHCPLLPIRGFYCSSPVLTPSLCAGCARMEANPLYHKGLHHPELMERTGTPSKMLSGCSYCWRDLHISLWGREYVGSTYAGWRQKSVTQPWLLPSLGPQPTESIPLISLKFNPFPIAITPFTFFFFFSLFFLWLLWVQSEL